MGSASEKVGIGEDPPNKTLGALVEDEEANAPGLGIVETHTNGCKACDNLETD